MKTALVLFTAILLSFNLTACGQSAAEKQRAADEKASKEHNAKRNQF